MRTLLIAALVVGGFFSVLIPYFGTVVWLASWGAAIYLIIQRVRMGARTRGAVRRTGRR